MNELTDQERAYVNDRLKKIRRQAFDLFTELARFEEDICVHVWKNHEDENERSYKQCERCYKVVFIDKEGV